MGGMEKSLVYELIIETADHAHDAWRNKLVCTCSVCLIFIEDLEFNVVKIFMLIILTKKVCIESCGRCMMSDIHRRPQENRFNI